MILRRKTIQKILRINTWLAYEFYLQENSHYLLQLQRILHLMLSQTTKDSDFLQKSYEILSSHFRHFPMKLKPKIGLNVALCFFSFSLLRRPACARS